MAKSKLKKPFARGVRWKNGAWRYRVPRWVDAATRRRVFEGRSEVTLGSSTADAAQRYGEIMRELEDGMATIVTMADLMDRYSGEVVPLKAPSTQRNNLISLARLRPVFGHMLPEDFQSHHAFKYRDLRRDYPTSANRDLEVLSHLFSKAIEWGVLRNDQHPIRGLRIKNTTTPGDRYVTDQEVAAALPYANPFIDAYVDLKLALGLRKSDMLRLALNAAKEDGIHVKPHKTANSSGKKTVYPWNDARRRAWAKCLAVRPQRVSSLTHLFCTRRGDPYIKDDGTTSGFNSIFRRWVQRAIDADAISTWFTENDLRAKVASDSEDLEQARRRLSHTSVNTTRRFYHRKPERAD
jgi:integrase